ncbi:MAG: amidohydrolase family protein [Planctomycetota bacterium]
MKTSHNNNSFVRVLFALLALALVTTMTAAPVAAQSKSSKSPAKKAEKDETDKDDEKSDSEKEEKPEYLAVQGSDIHTVTDGVVRQGTILIKDGKIEEVGNNVTIPEGTKVIDATGKIVCPGFVAISMRSVGLRSTPSGANKLKDSLDPFDQNIKYALGVGITTGCVELSTSGRFGRFGSPQVENTPGEPADLFPGLEEPVEERLTEQMIDYGDLNTALCPCCGLPVLPTEPIVPTRPSTAKPRKMSVIKLAYGNVGDMLAKEEVFYNPSPGALNGALNRHNWRLEIKKAKDAIQAEAGAAKEAAKKPTSSKTTTSKTSSDKSKSTKPSTSSSSKTKKPKANPAIIKLLKGETKMRVRSDAYDEINDLSDLAQEHGYELVIEGGTEAWALSEKLSKAGVQVIYTPRRRREPVDGRENNSGSNFESPMIFENVGIPFATSTLSNSISMNGLAGRDLTSLPLEAAFAVRGGASERTALESLTIVPARLMGLGDRIGSIEVGKDADLLILNGEPLDYKTYVEQAIVAGKVSYERGKDRVYPVYERED